MQRITIKIKLTIYNIIAFKLYFNMSAVQVQKRSNNCIQYYIFRLCLLMCFGLNINQIIIINQATKDNNSHTSVLLEFKILNFSS